MMKMYAIAAVILALTESSVALRAQQDVLQFNVTYKCPDGYNYVVHRCEPGPKGGGVCYFQLGQDSERYNTRTQVENLIRTCKLIGSPPAGAQAKSADYTDDMPSVDQVKAAIKGSDPSDTLVRQYAAFIGLNKHIFDIKVERTVSGPYTPSELRVRNAYDLAKNQLEQEYAKSHTPEQMAGFNRLWFRYTMDEDLYRTWNKLIGPQSRAAIKSTQDANAARRGAYYDKAMAQYKQDSAAQQAGNRQFAQMEASAPGATGLSNDPTAVATRRCLELGGSDAGCMGKGFMSGLMDLVGFNTETKEAIAGPGRAGVVLSGLYKSPATTTTLGFGENGVSIDGCDKLVADSHNYTIDKRPGTLKVTVENEPHPIVLTIRPDGGFTGPGLIDVKGKIIIGYHTVTETLMINGVRAAPDQCNGPCQTSTRVPDYAPATGHCTIGSLAPPPPTKSAGAPAQPADASGIMGLVTGVTDMLSPGGGAPVGGGGLRMTGKYGGGKLLLDFSGNSLVLDCGQAHIRQPYTVENTPNALLVHVNNSGGPFTLALQPENSLVGSGTTTVNGKLVTGMNSDNVTFAPHSERCDVGTLRPNTGSAAASSVAAASPAPAPVAANSAAPASATSAISAGGIKLSISTSFPNAPKLLAGHIVFLMSDRFDNVMRKSGAPVPAGATSGSAYTAWVANCAPPKDCSAINRAMAPFFVGQGKLDDEGKAIMSAPTGSYFVLVSGHNANGWAVWNLPITLKAGDNAMTLTAANGELVR
jgi:hypothetical protein